MALHDACKLMIYFNFPACNETMTFCDDVFHFRLTVRESSRGSLPVVVLHWPARCHIQDVCRQTVCTHCHSHFHPSNPTNRNLFLVIPIFSHISNGYKSSGFMSGGKEVWSRTTNEKFPAARAADNPVCCLHKVR